MSKAIKYLEQVATIDESELGDTFETVSINEAIIACELQELETLQNVQINPTYIEDRLNELNRKLKHIKIK